MEEHYEEAPSGTAEAQELLGAGREGIYRADSHPREIRIPAELRKVKEKATIAIMRLAGLGEITVREHNSLGRVISEPTWTQDGLISPQMLFNHGLEMRSQASAERSATCFPDL